MSIRVKPLEWKPTDDEMGRNGWRYRAKTVIRSYTVETIVHGQLGERWIVPFWDKSVATKEEAFASCGEHHRALVETLVEELVC